jgi:hypothetical protein
VSADYSEPLRSYSYRTARDPLERAASIANAEEFLIEAVLTVGLMLTKAYGSTFFSELEASVAEMREVQNYLR